MNTKAPEVLEFLQYVSNKAIEDIESTEMASLSSLAVIIPTMITKIIEMKKNGDLTVSSYGITYNDKLKDSAPNNELETLDLDKNRNLSTSFLENNSNKNSVEKSINK